MTQTMNFDRSQVDTIANLMEPFSWYGISYWFFSVKHERAISVLLPFFECRNGAGIKGKRADGSGSFWGANHRAALKVSADSLANGNATVVEIGPFQGKDFASSHAGVCEQSKEWIDIVARIFFAGVEEGVEFGFCPEWTILLHGWRFAGYGDVIGWV